MERIKADVEKKKNVVICDQLKEKVRIVRMHGRR